ncbi:hypothetical protein ACFUIW_10325 [Streptomyces sp. NPDC057245]|uniref:hypothetical protein n=1 Tax=Streptomyces TaxID=1883 RepID=UPI001C1DFDB6|nr:hypothetical protein [Streptomyces sp. A108]MBU6536017.1 hypothetical protein [Streptomyces sp. A108]
MTDRRGAAADTCHGPYGAGSGAAGCGDPARFEVARYQRPPLHVCPVHLGPSLLLADGVLWPPVISLIGGAGSDGG